MGSRPQAATRAPASPRRSGPARRRPTGAAGWLRSGGRDLPDDLRGDIPPGLRRAGQRLQHPRQHRDALYPPSWQPCTAGLLAAAHGCWRSAGRHRHDRAWRRKRSGRHARQCAEGSWWLEAQRQQGIYHQRPAGRHGDRLRQDGPERPGPRRLAVSGGYRIAGLLARQSDPQDRPARKRHCRAVLRRSDRAGGCAAWRSGQGLRLSDARAASRTSGCGSTSDRSHRRCASPDPGLRATAPCVRSADRRLPEHPLRAGRRTCATGDGARLLRKNACSAMPVEK